MNDRRRIGLLGCAVLCLMSACASQSTHNLTPTYIPAPAPSADPNTAVPVPAASGVAIVTNASLHLCLQTDSSNVAQIGTCKLPQDEQFTLVRGQVRNAAGLCLDLQNSNTQPGAIAVFTACTTDFSAPSQIWTYDGGYLYFTSNALPSLCLSPSSGNLTPGGGLQLELCATSSLRWSVAPQGGQLSNDANQCLTAAMDGNSMAPQLGACSADSNQLWTLNGNAIQRGGDSNTCLALPAGTAAGSPAAIAPCDNSVAQTWFYDGFDGTLRFRQAGTCLDGNSVVACDPNNAWTLGLTASH